MTINLYWWKIGFLSRSHLPQQDNIDFWKEANGLLKGIVDWRVFRLISLSIQENILTSITANRNGGLMQLSTAGLSNAEKMITELLKYEQDEFSTQKKKSFTLTQVLILIRLAKLSAKGIKYEKLSDLQSDFANAGLDIPDFKMSRNANNLCGGRLREDDAKQMVVEGWGLCDMKVSPENKRWMTIALNKKGFNLMKRLSEGRK